jgi:hypothetical protein
MNPSKASDPAHISAHRHSIRHREEILSSDLCGCFNCIHTFPPTEITEWCDTQNGVGTTALCPQCGIDSVIGSQSGYPITTEFLRQMQEHWF